MKNQKTMGNKGFSLVELIVVIAIMAVLVGVLAPQFIKYVEKSRISTDIQNMEQLKTSIEVYVAENPVSAQEKFSNSVFSTATTQTYTASTGSTFEKAMNNAGLGTSITFKSKKWTGVNITISTDNKVTVEGSATYDGKTYSMAGN